MSGDLPLRWVLMMSLARAEIAALVFGAEAEAEVHRWPGSLYALAAAELGRRAWARRRVRLRLETRLAPALERHRNASLMDLSRDFRDAAEAHAGRELAAILWILVEREQPLALELGERLARELEVAAARHLFDAPRTESHLRPPRSPEADRLAAIG